MRRAEYEEKVAEIERAKAELDKLAPGETIARAGLQGWIAHLESKIAERHTINVVAEIIMDQYGGYMQLDSSVDYDESAGRVSVAVDGRKVIDESLVGFFSRLGIEPTALRKAVYVMEDGWVN